MKQSRMGVFLLAIAFIAFISLGLPDGLLGVAWVSMSADLGAPLNGMGVVVAGVTSGYVLSTVLSGKLVAWMGIGRLLALSCGMTAAALIGYTIIPVWWMLLFMGVLAGLGGGAIDAAINNFISHHHRAWLFLLHAMFGIGTTTGPLIMNTALNTATWRLGYWVVGAFQVGLALTFLITAKRWDDAPPADADATSPTPPMSIPPARLRDTAKLTTVRLGVAFFLLYTGTEASIGQWSYTLFTQTRATDANTAAFFIGAYWGAFTLGRVVSGWIVRVISEHTYMRVCMMLAVLSTMLMWLNIHEALSLLGLPLAGFAVAPMFPAMVGSTQDRLPTEHITNAIGFQIGAAGLGAGILIGAGSVLSGIFGLGIIFIINLASAIAIFILYEVIYLRGVRYRQMRQAST
jgi:fucose permease